MFKNPRIAIALTASLNLVCSLLAFSAANAGEPLQGSASETDIAPTSQPLKMMEPMPAPVVPQKKLEGKADETGKRPLSGEAEDEDEANLQPMKPRADKNAKVLEGNAQMQEAGESENPDSDDEDIMVEWDRWRNRFLRAVQNGVQESLSNTGDLQMRFDPRTGRVMARFPMGTTCWFSCQVTPDRRVVHLKIVNSSGFPNFDQAVIDSVMALEGSALLRYPKGSKRRIVSQMAGIKTSDSPNQQYYHFGDVEHYRTQGY